MVDGLQNVERSGLEFWLFYTNLLAVCSWSTNNLSDIDRSRDENENQTHTEDYKYLPH